MSDKSTVFHLVACFCERASMSDQKLFCHPTMLNGVCVGNIRHSLVQSPRKSLIYRVIQEESAIPWEMIVCVILSKKVHMNMGPILNGYRDIVKRRYGPSCEHEQQLRNK